MIFLSSSHIAEETMSTVFFTKSSVVSYGGGNINWYVVIQNELGQLQIVARGWNSHQAGNVARGLRLTPGTYKIISEAQARQFFSRQQLLQINESTQNPF